MKTIYILAIVIFCTPLFGLCQKIDAIELCNGTQSLYYFGTATSSITYFLLKKDISILDEINFSDRNKVNNNYLLSLSKKFDSVFVP